MEPHPVPQNIVDVEFKLFGSFSLRQFGQILVGCMVGVIIYFLPIIPFIVKVPVILISVFAGLLSAIIPSFGTWMAGFAKALIIAPRYVWVKEPPKSDLLQQPQKQQKSVKAAQTADSNLRADRLDSLVISSAANDKDDVMEDFLMQGAASNVEKENFNKLYDKVYDSDLKPVVASTNREVVQTAQANNQKLNNPTPESHDLSVEQILKQIEVLKNQLSSISKDTDKDRETEILNNINDLYAQYKVLKVEKGVTPQNTPQNATQAVKDFSKPTNQGKLIFGLVVTKEDKVVADADISLVNSETKEVFKGKSGADGKFSTASKIPFGAYDIQISHPVLKFHTYRIEVTEARLPAFKFREK